jgi:hypothetical protein
MVNKYKYLPAELYNLHKNYLTIEGMRDQILISLFTNLKTLIDLNNVTIYLFNTKQIYGDQFEMEFCNEINRCLV